VKARTVVLGTLVSLLGVTGSLTARATPGIVVCASFNPYTASSAALRSCGEVRYPRLGTLHLADGGVASIYNYDGLRIEMNVPPLGLDLAKATAAERTLYGLPPEPPARDAASHDQWQATIRSLHFVSSPPALYSDPAFRGSGTAKLLNWSGYYTGGSTFTSAFGEYVEPGAHTSCSPNSVSYWAGLGGIYSKDLAQNGTAQNEPGIGPDQAWWEILPYAPVVIQFWASVGYVFEPETATYDNGKSFNFSWYNAHTDGFQELNVVVTGGYSGALTSADFITERPLVNGKFANLTNFGTASWQGVNLANGVPFGNYTNYNATMVNSAGVTLATASSLSSKESFSVTYHRCN